MEPDLRVGIGCPTIYRNLILGERFKCLPWDISEADAELALPYLHALAIEGDMNRLLSGVPRDETLTLYGADDD